MLIEEIQKALLDVKELLDSKSNVEDTYFSLLAWEKKYESLLNYLKKRS